MLLVHFARDIFIGGLGRQPAIISQDESREGSYV
jgi:hypothetical protein